MLASQLFISQRTAAKEDKLHALAPLLIARLFNRMQVQAEPGIGSKTPHWIVSSRLASPLSLALLISLFFTHNSLLSRK
jgi:hypothetical protein